MILEEFKGFESVATEGNNNKPKSPKIGGFLCSFCH